MLGVLWRSRQWRLLANLIEHLPRDSHFAEAVLNDAEYVEAIKARGLPEPAERISEWSSEREALAQIIDALHALTQVAIAAAGGNPATVHAVRRPATALDKVEADDRQRRYEELLAKIFGQR